MTIAGAFRATSGAACAPTCAYMPASPYSTKSPKTPRSNRPPTSLRCPASSARAWPCPTSTRATAFRSAAFAPPTCRAAWSRRAASVSTSIAACGWCAPISARPRCGPSCASWSTRSFATCPAAPAARASSRSTPKSSTRCSSRDRAGWCGTATANRATPNTPRPAARSTTPIRGRFPTAPKSAAARSSARSAAATTSSKCSTSTRSPTKKRRRPWGSAKTRSSC